MALEIGVFFYQEGGVVAGFGDGVGVGEAGHFEIGDARLADAVEFAGAAHGEVDLGEGETGLVLDHGGEAFG